MVDLQGQNVHSNKQHVVTPNKDMDTYMAIILYSMFYSSLRLSQYQNFASSNLFILCFLSFQ